jgi:hypothetical protein
VVEGSDAGDDVERGWREAVSEHVTQHVVDVVARSRAPAPYGTQFRNSVT